MGGRRWIVIGVAVLFLISAFAYPVIVGKGRSRPSDDPWARMPAPAPHTDHSALIQGPVATGPEATRECLRCHENQAHDFMKTSHWTWLGRDVTVPGRTDPVRLGKRNMLNNFCIGVQSNWELCTSCHAGYGWTDASFDFTNPKNIDCLVCHDGTGAYFKSKGGGYPGDGVDLLAVARSVGRPTRRNCGYCHFKGGGGDAVKHGDMDGTFYFPSERIDVHLGRYDFECVDCHRTERHEMGGRAPSVSADVEGWLECTDCHLAAPHANERLNRHVRSVACQTCHIPRMAVGAPTKMSWDWSTAGEDWEEDSHHYMKIKGSFTYAQNVAPEYYWFNRHSHHYLQGDKIDPEGITDLNRPQGEIRDPDARIWPFKVHRAKQIYDAVNNTLIVPKTVGSGGYWTEFDWDRAARLGSEATGLPYSGEYGFVRTDMHWPMTHMVAPVGEALQCIDCHTEGGRLDWQRLGFDGDPAYRGNPRSIVFGVDAASTGGVK